MTPDLTFLLQPRSIAVVGASNAPESFGARLLRTICGWAYAGEVYPVNPRQTELAGRACYPSVGALPVVPDCVAMAVSDARVEAALEEAAAAGVRAAVLFGRGYEPSISGRPSRSQRLGAIARAAGMAVCGNNCMGFMNSAARLMVCGNGPPVRPQTGDVALISHGGSTWSGLLANQRDLFFNYAISAGQEIATTLADYLQFVVAQPETRVIGCILETVRDPERFLGGLSAADARGIPIVALKLGRTEQARRFALAHSGALSGSAAAYDAIFARHNVVGVKSVDELVDTIELFRCARRPTAPAAGIVTDSGAERELIVDLAHDIGCPLAELTEPTQHRLAEVLDPGMEPVNPVDSYGDGRTLLEPCLQVIADDPNVGVVVLATNLVHGRPYLQECGAAIENTAAATDKPALVFGNLHSTISREEATRLRATGVPVLMGTCNALSAISHFLAWHFCRPVAPVPAPPAEPPVSAWRDRLAGARGKPLDPVASLEMFAAFGGKVVASHTAARADELIAAAEGVGYPVVLKTANPALLHKSDEGGVVLDIRGADELARAYDRLASCFGPAAFVQKQIAGGVEILVGMVKDAQFGPMVTFGIGGIYAEVLAQVVTVQPPIAAAEAIERLRDLRGFKLLCGARGQPAVDLNALGHAIERFSAMCAALGPFLQEVDINPLIAGPDGAVAVDALIVPAISSQSAP
ncbi:MAG: acetate--CoA ligase family protein [Acetobacteraceae bacterium]|nr:acetate--CoA ligase family protein [Acetobacteraceae bacterium]